MKISAKRKHTPLRSLFMPLLCIAALSMFQSCTKWVAPPYTNVTEISKVKQGMTINRVNEVLGIEPYDIYTVQEDGSTVLLYNYRVKDRRTTVTGRFDKFVRSEAAQKGGDPWYGDPSIVYILFKEDKVSSLITNKGREDADHLLLTNNNIQLISKKELVSLQESEQQDLLILGDNQKISTVTLPKKEGSKSVAIPLKPESKAKSPTSQKLSNGTGKKILRGVMIIGGAIALIAIIGSLASAAEEY